MTKPYFILLLFCLGLFPGIIAQETENGIMPPACPDSIIAWKFDAYGDSTLNTLTKYRYDSHMHTIESEKFTREQSLNLWIPQRKDLWEYDSHDRRTLWAIYEWDINTSAYKGWMKETIEYDNNGNKVQYYYYTWNYTLSDWQNYHWDVFLYDAQNKILRRNHLEWNTASEQWDTASYDIYDYGLDGLLQHLTIWEPDEDFGGVIYPSERIDYQYDGSGNEIENIHQIYNTGTGLWYLTVRHQYWYDTYNRKTNSLYSEYDEGEEIWIDKEKDDWGWDDSDSLILYAYYRIGEDLVTWYPDLKAEMTYNSYGSLVHYRTYSGNDQAQWVPTYERRYSYQDGTIQLSDSLFQWLQPDEAWELVDCHLFQYDSLTRLHTDSYYSYVVHIGEYLLHFRDYYFYSGNAGIDELYQDDWILYPNPASSVVYLKSSIFSQRIIRVELFDLFGEVVLEEEKGSRGEEETSIDVSAFPAGIYFVRIYHENQILVKKIIKL
ncbi:MAG: T9SS type A sorting domain-containing protein [Bacteroidetes bacterium]|nr:T9SS type A sorting domain-containing protein [Bacteroidota bacterium]